MPTHQYLPLTKHKVSQNVMGVSTSAAITVTATSTVAIPFLVTTKPMSTNWLIKTATVTRDGVSYTESYRSDV
jgi:hypothetical protein